MRLRWWVVIALLMVGIVIGYAISPPVSRAAEPRQEYVRVTFYVLRGTMASGVQTRPDAAACSQWMPFGTQLMFDDGYVVTCLDRGHGDRYWPGWVDIWAPSMDWGARNVRASYGDYAWVQVVRWGWE